MTARVLTDRPDGGRTRRRTAHAFLALLVAGLAACSPTGGGARSEPSAAPSASAPALAESLAESPAAGSAASSAVLAAAARTAGTPVRSGTVTLHVAAHEPPVAAGDQADGSVVVAVVVAPGEPDPIARRLAAVLAAPAGLRFEARADRSVAVLAEGGEVVGALPPIVAVDGTGARLGADLAVRTADPGLLDVLVDPGPAGRLRLTFGATPLAGADWGEREGGRSLAVVPAAWVRTGGRAAQDALWSALVAGVPEAALTTMHDQLTCHALGAATKESWNLEPWRPEVDPVTMLVARCNP